LANMVTSKPERLPKGMGIDLTICVVRLIRPLASGTCPRKIRFMILEAKVSIPPFKKDEQRTIGGKSMGSTPCDTVGTGVHCLGREYLSIEILTEGNQIGRIIVGI